MVKCPQCQKNKLEKEFSKHRNRKNGLQIYCKSCVNCNSAQYYKRKKRQVKANSKARKRAFCKNRKNNIILFITGMYHKMYNRVRGYNSPSYNGKEICTRKEFYAFAKRNAELSVLFKIWKESNHEYRLTPSVDRLDNAKGYTVDNIQFMALVDNVRKQ